MIVKDGRIVAIDHVEVDGITITGDGIFPKKCGGKPLGVGPGVTSAVSGSVVSSVSGQIDKQIDKKVSTTSAVLDKKITAIEGQLKTVSSTLNNQITALSSSIDKKFTNVNSNIERLDTKIDLVSEKVNTLSSKTDKAFEEVNTWADEVDEKIQELSARPAGSSAFLSKDLFVTNDMGMIKKFTTIPMGTSLESIWTSALSDTISPKAGGISLNISNTNFLPGTQTLTTISFNATAGAIPLTGYSFKIANGNITSAETFISGMDSEGQHSRNLTSAVNYTTDQNFTVFASAFDGTNTVTAESKVSFYWPYFYGESIDSGVDISTLTKLSQTKSNKTVKYNALGQYLIFAFDSSYSDLAKIIDANGFDTTNGFIMTTAEYAGHQYKVYVSDEVKTYSDNYTFNHG